MSSAPDPHSFIHDLKGDLFQELVLKLNENGAWKKLATAVPIFNSDHIKSFEQTRSPSTEILNELDIKLCTVQTLCILLAQCQLHEALALLSEPKPLKIEKQPGNSDEEVFVSFGSVLKLEVVATGVPPPQYLWRHDNLDLKDQTNSVLLITDFGPQHEGEYLCIVNQQGTNGDIEEISEPIQVYILPEPPIVKEQPKPVSCRVGEEVLLECQVTCYPPPQYQWMHYNSVLEGETKNVLKITHVTDANAGTYVCRICNKFGNEIFTEPVKVSVFESPDDHEKRIGRVPCIVEEKVALLIANDQYDHLDPLRTPRNDVEALSRLLTKLGFKVLALCNMTLIEMTNAVKTLCDLMPESAYVIFYFGGHGFELQDKYMLPVDCPEPKYYRRSDSLCERFVIQKVLERSPQLLLLLLDMCLKIPKMEENPGIYAEPSTPVLFEPKRNLIQGYATTSNMGAYERRTEKNGIYVKHLLKFLSKDVPVIRILEKVNKSISEETGEAVKLQMPSYTNNVVTDKHYLTVPSKENKKTAKLVAMLNSVQKETKIYFKHIEQWSVVTFSKHRNCFHNILEVRLKGLDQWRVVCHTACKDLKMGLVREGGDIVLSIYNLQKLQMPKLHVSVLLYSQTTGELVSNSTTEISNPLITSARLWSHSSCDNTDMKLEPTT